jgi:hypothetical protein
MNWRLWKRFMRQNLNVSRSFVLILMYFITIKLDVVLTHQCWLPTWLISPPPCWTTDIILDPLLSRCVDADPNLLFCQF